MFSKSKRKQPVSHDTRIIRIIGNKHNVCILHQTDIVDGELIQQIDTTTDKRSLKKHTDIFKQCVNQYFKEIGSKTTLFDFRNILKDDYSILFHTNGLLKIPMNQSYIRRILKMSKNKYEDLTKYGFMIDDSYYRAFVSQDGKIIAIYLVKVLSEINPIFESRGFRITLKSCPKVVGHNVISDYDRALETCEALFLYEGIARTANEIKKLTGWNKQYLKRKLKRMVKVRDGEVRITL